MFQDHFSSQRQVFQKYIQQIKTLMQERSIKLPTGFISYAWEEDKNKNIELQHMLTQLKEDFEQLGISLFLDINQMHGEIRECMQQIKEKDFVIVIGTPRYKERTEHDSLYSIPTMDNNVFPKKGSAVIWVEDKNNIYFYERNTLSLVNEDLRKSIDLSQIEWINEKGYKRAKLSYNIISIIEKVKKQVSGSAVTNATFELGLIYDKANKNPNALVPLLMQGDLDTAFPKELTGFLIRDFRDPLKYFYHILGLTPLGLLPAIFPVLQNDNEYKRIVTEFLEWQFNTWKTQISQMFEEELQLYIPAQGDYTVDCLNSKPMEKHVREFLKNQSSKVMLILGGSGSGKSNFGQYLSQHMASDHYTPIWISLPSLKNPKERAIQEGLTLLGVPDNHIASLKNKPLLIILDGYDEVRDLGNLYDSNQLEKWNAKVIITCRSEFLTAKNYSLMFKPKNGSYIERYIAPFTQREISAYLQKYIQIKNDRWDLAKYETVINQISGLRQLIETPFLLHIVADVLPDIAAKYQDKNEHVKLTKRALYERFVDQWFERHIERWQDQSKISILDEGLDLDANDTLSWNDQRIAVLRSYAENFAYQLYSHKVDSISYKSQESWIKAIFDMRPREKLIRSACPIKKTGEENYGFIHKSLLEYLVTPSMIEEVRSAAHAKIPENSDIADMISHLNQQLLMPSMIQFLADAIKENPELQAGLWSVIKSSKKNPESGIAAANAMTILNYARISFSGKDLSNVCIPEADLKGAVLDNTNFEDADLSKVNFSGAWLQSTNFSNAKMSGISLGELPSLLYNNRPKLPSMLFEDKVYNCCYSHDGTMMAIAIGKEIELYDTRTHYLKKICKGHTKQIRSVCFSFDDQNLITGGEDNKAIVWLIKDNTIYHSYEGHQSVVSCVDVCSDNEHLATGSWDRTAKIWSLKSKSLIYTLNEHTGYVKCIQFNPDQQYLATGSEDTLVKIWSIKTGCVVRTIFAHEGAVNCLHFSLQGDKLATGSEDTKIKLWSVSDGAIIKTFEGHLNSVTCLDFSMDGIFLASGSEDNKVKLWSMEYQTLLKTFEGHFYIVTDVHFSPDDQHLLSGSLDNTVKVWLIEHNVDVKKSEGHAQYVSSVCFSPSTKHVISGSFDKTVKIWSVEDGSVVKTLEGHLELVSSVHLSFDSHYLISGSWDSTLKIWSFANAQLLRSDTVCRVACAKISPDKSCIAITSLDNNLIQLYSTHNASLLQQLKGHNNCVWCVEFSENGMCIASGSWDNTAMLWALESDNLFYLKFTFQGHQHYVVGVGFSSCNQYLVTSSWDKTIRIWSLVDGTSQALLEGHTNYVRDVCFCSDVQWLVSSSSDCTLRFWNYSLQTKQIYSFVTKVSSEANSIALYENKMGIFLVSGHGDYSVRYWQLCEVNQKPYLLLIWSSHQNALLSQNACIANVKDLSADNAELLKQRGAIQEMTKWNSPKLFSIAGNKLSDSKPDNDNVDNKTRIETHSNAARVKNNCTVS